MRLSKDYALRPADWDSYIGQEPMKERLQISIDSAIRRGAALDHVLLDAPPGMGKTSIAALIAKEMEVSEPTYTAKVMPIKIGVLYSIIIEKGGILLFDELHRMPKKDQESMLSILEDRIIQRDNGDTIIIPKQFTIIGATTEIKQVIKPLRDRFIHKPRFQPYSNDDMALIFTGMCHKLGIYPSDDEAIALGIASAGVPRQAKSLALTARDLNTTNVEEVLTTANVTEDGYTQDHLEYLSVLDHIGGLGGIELMSNYTGMPKDVILDIERLLLDRGCIEYTQKGRSLMVKGLNIINKYDVKKGA